MTQLFPLICMYVHRSVPGFQTASINPSPYFSKHFHVHIHNRRLGMHIKFAVTCQHAIVANEGFFLLKSPSENTWNPGNGAIPQGRYPNVGILNPNSLLECHGGRRREKL